MRYCTSMMALLLACNACASRRGDARTTLRLTHAANVSAAGGQTPVLSIKAGGALELANDPLFVEAEGLQTVLVVPVPVDASGSVVEGKLTLPQSTGGIDAAKERLDARKMLTESYKAFLPRFFESQVQATQGRRAEALDALTALRADFPEIAYTDFFIADVLHALARDPEARVALDAALREFPRDARGLQLKSRIDARLRTKGTAP